MAPLPAIGAVLSTGGQGDTSYFKAVAAAVEQRKMEAKTEWPELKGVPCEVQLFPSAGRLTWFERQGCGCVALWLLSQG